MFLTRFLMAKVLARACSFDMHTGTKKNQLDYNLSLNQSQSLYIHIHYSLKSFVNINFLKPVCMRIVHVSPFNTPIVNHCSKSCSDTWVVTFQKTPSTKTRTVLWYSENLYKYKLWLTYILFFYIYNFSYYKI